ncbi:MAG TPA: multicopper oxidase family protein [Alphaproteobacteria bacterium]|nr:multicopper oxidase family protein [Alphaproteobacteria bacterium]
MFIGRRSLIAAGAGALVAAGLPHSFAATRELRLAAGPTRAKLVGDGHPATDVWAYNGAVPGPVLRFRQGERARIVVENRLPQPTSVHWHGLRVPNAMDGVPDLTQPPIAPGESFAYEFDLHDAGTYWYHPHANSAEQVGRGLAGAIVVEESQPPAVDRDLLWVLDDWRLDRGARIADDFGHPRDASHAGRMGNTVTFNGAVPDSLEVRAGERMRLRLVNVANARIFGLRLEGHAPYVIARDGQPVDPYPVRGGMIVLAPGERCDLIVDMHGEPGERFAVIDAFYPQAAYRLVELVYAASARGARAPAAPPARLPDNPWKRPDTSGARRERIVIEGGMMGGFRGARLDGRQLDARALFQQGKMWALNGEVAGDHHQMAPLLTLRRGESVVVELVNDSVWNHPMHLHGMFFEVLSLDGVAPPRREFRDTLTLGPRGRAETAFRADAPGDWMFHCHVLEHQDSGLMGIVRVT